MLNPEAPLRSGIHRSLGGFFAWSAMKVRVKVYGFLAVVAVLAAAWHFGSPYLNKDSKDPSADTSQEEKSDAGAIPVQVEEARQGSISSFLTSTSNLRALREVDLMAQAEGPFAGFWPKRGTMSARGSSCASWTTGSW